MGLQRQILYPSLLIRVTVIFSEMMRAYATGSKEYESIHIVKYPLTKFFFLQDSESLL
jgi:hypothetical protein